MAPTPPERFRVDPLLYLVEEEHERAVQSLNTYFERFTGRWFEILADPDPFSISGSDLVAVSMLGVNVPANTAAWLLGDGKSLVSGLLRQIPVGFPIWDPNVDLSPNGASWRLWDEIRTGQWPADRKEKSGMGRTTTSKLLAVKRPHLLPVWDSVVAEALLGPKPTSTNWWDLWRVRLQAPDGDELRRQVDALLKEAPQARHLSVLRTIDVVIWMRERGWEDAPKLVDFNDAPPVGGAGRSST
jgi:hypothetical protein